MSQAITLPQAQPMTIAKLFSCSYDKSRTRPLATPAAEDPQKQPEVVTYGMEFEKLCAAIVSAKKSLGTMTDYRDLDPGMKKISVEGLIISDIEAPIYLDKVEAKVLIIDNCGEVNISEVAVDSIAVRECHKIAMSGIDAEYLLAFKCEDVIVAEFRTKYGVLQSNRIRLGDGSCKKVSVLSNLLFVDGALDRMSSWDLYSPVLHIGPMVPPICPSPRIRVYANTYLPSEWTDTAGLCNLKKLMLDVNEVFDASMKQMPVVSDEARDMINGLNMFNSFITMLGGGDTTLTPASGFVSMAKKSLDLYDAAEKELLGDTADEQVSVFVMLTEKERKVILPIPPVAAGQVHINPRGNENNVPHVPLIDPNAFNMTGEMQVPDEIMQQVLASQAATNIPPVVTEQSSTQEVISDQHEPTKAERAAAAQAERRPVQGVRK